MTVHRVNHRGNPLGKPTGAYGKYLPISPIVPISPVATSSLRSLLLPIPVTHVHLLARRREAAVRESAEAFPKAAARPLRARLPLKATCVALRFAVHELHCAGRGRYVARARSRKGLGMSTSENRPTSRSLSEPLHTPPGMDDTEGTQNGAQTAAQPPRRPHWPRCQLCGGQMFHPASIATGICARHRDIRPIPADQQLQRRKS